MQHKTFKILSFQTIYAQDRNQSKNDLTELKNNPSQKTAFYGNLTNLNLQSGEWATLAKDVIKRNAISTHLWSL